MTFYCMVCRGPMLEKLLNKKARTCRPECSVIWRLEYLKRRRGRYPVANGKKVARNTVLEQLQEVL